MNFYSRTIDGIKLNTLRKNEFLFENRKTKQDLARFTRIPYYCKLSPVKLANKIGEAGHPLP